MNPRSVVVCLFVFLLTLSFCCERLAAQSLTTGGVTGVVSDPSGAVVPNARVTLKSNTKGTVQEAKTNSAGVYQFQLVDPGSYLVTVTAGGFQTTSQNVGVSLGQPAALNIQLSVEQAAQTVTVTEAAPLVQVENGNVSTTLSQQQVSEIPNPGNDISYVALFAPGVVMNTQGAFGNFSAEGVGGTANLFTLNGMADNDPYLNLNNSGATNLLLGQNEIEEATVVNNGFSGEYGSMAGANINYVTKSGGNQFHGNAIYYWNGRTMNANDFFNNAGGAPRPFSNANQWAASFGGPVKRDKLFFFVNTEGLRVLIPVTSSVVLPSSQFQQATLANLNAKGRPDVANFYSNQIFSVLNAAPGAANATPVAGGGCNGFTGLGTGVPCAVQFRANSGNLTHEWQLASRVDYNMGPNDRAFLRYQYDVGLQATFTDPINSVFNVRSSQPEHQGQIEWTHSFGAAAVNQFLVAGQWYTAIFNNQNISSALNKFPTTLGIADGSFFNTAPGNLCASIAGFAMLIGGEDCNNPQGRNVTQAGVSDDASKTWGHHTLKFGGQFRRLDISDHDYGTFQSGLLLVNNITSFFNGGASGDLFIQSFPKSLDQPMAYYTLGLYAQDEWRVRDNLTLTFALRGEHDSNPICRSLCFARLAGPFSQVSHDPNQSYSQAIQVNQFHPFTGLQSILWQPRVSFAWQPFGANSHTVIRGGIGIFYNLYQAVVTDNFSQNPPLDPQFVSSNDFIVPGTANGPSIFNDSAASNQAFQTGFVSGLTLSQIQQGAPFHCVPGGPCGFAPPNIFTSERTLQIPQYQKWSLEIQHGFGANTAVTLGYVGNHGIHEWLDNNAANAFGFGNLPARVPDSRFTEVSVLASAGVSNYNGLTLSFNHKVNHWGTGVFQANYTWSHAFDQISNGLAGFTPFTLVSIFNPQDPNNLRGSYGPADYDVRHYVNANYVWELPIRKALRGHGWERLTDGWQVSGALFARTGLPYTVIDGGLDTQLASSNNYFSQVIPQYVSGPTGCHTGAAIPACLGATTQFTATGFSSGQRGFFRGPDYFDTDLTVVKNTKIPGWERGKLGIGLQFFNVLNHPNFNLPNTSISSGSFGQIQSLVSVPTSILGSFLGGDAAPRLIQLKAQFTF